MSTLDEAWAAAEAALPEEWDLELGTYSPNPKRYWAAAYGPERAGIHPHRDGWGPTPTAALQNLARSLLENPGGTE